MKCFFFMTTPSTVQWLDWKRKWREILNTKDKAFSWSTEPNRISAGTIGKSGKSWTFVLKNCFLSRRLHPPSTLCDWQVLQYLWDERYSDYNTTGATVKNQHYSRPTVHPDGWQIKVEVQQTSSQRSTKRKKKDPLVERGKQLQAEQGQCTWIMYVLHVCVLVCVLLIFRTHQAAV